MERGLSCLLVVLFIAACQEPPAAVPAPPPAPAPAPPLAPGVGLSVEPRIVIGGVEQPLARGRGVKTGDRVHFVIESEEPLDLALFAWSSAGDFEPAYPANGTIRIEPNRRQRIPPESSEHFEIDGEPGRESLAFVAVRARQQPGMPLPETALARARAFQAAAPDSAAIVELLVQRALAGQEAAFQELMESRSIAIIDEPPPAREVTTARGEPGSAELVLVYDIDHRAPATPLAEYDGRVSPARPPEGAVPTLATLGRRIGDSLPEGTRLLLYDHDGARLHAFAIGRDGIEGHGHREVSGDELLAAVERFRVALVTEASDAQRAVELVETLGIPAPPSLDQAQRELEWLLLPGTVGDAVARARHLVVVPTGIIGTVPFSVLRGRKRAIVEHASVSIAPSIRDLWSSPRPWTRRFERSLVVGNPRFDLPQIPQLPGAEREARAVAALLGSAPLVGGDATRAAVLEQMGAAELVYLATHASVDHQRPLDASYLLFAGDRSGWLSPRELQRRFVPSPLRARLVVLSACRTGLGGYHRGGVIGIARSIQLSGAERVVMSQWSVDDDATADLMVHFFEALEREPPAEALRIAMLALRARRPEPAFWAPFVLLGLPR